MLELEIFIAFMGKTVMWIILVLILRFIDKRNRKLLASNVNGRINVFFFLRVIYALEQKVSKLVEAFMELIGHSVISKIP